MGWRLAVLAIGTALAVLAPTSGAAARPVPRHPIDLEETAAARAAAARPSTSGTAFPFGAADVPLIALAVAPAAAFAVRRRRLSTTCDSYTAA
jgi:hypothetical protein